MPAIHAWSPQSGEHYPASIDLCDLGQWFRVLLVEGNVHAFALYRRDLLDQAVVFHSGGYVDQV